jgi:hypothetical protein
MAGTHARALDPDQSSSGFRDEDALIVLRREMPRSRSIGGNND